MAEPTGELGLHLSPRGVEDVRAPVLDGNPRGLEAVGSMRDELVFEGWRPAE
jgi:hypothetical protein